MVNPFSRSKTPNSQGKPTVFLTNKLTRSNVKQMDELSKK